MYKYPPAYFMSSDINIQYPVLAPGIAIGPMRLKPVNGSIGLIVRYQGKQMILSCYHVLVADANFRIGDEIGQPSTSGNLVATLWPEFALTTRCDFALAEIKSRQAHNRVQGLDLQIAKFADKSYTNEIMQSGKRITKRGTASGVTRGKIASLGKSTKVTYPSINKEITLNDQIEIKGDAPPFSIGGDSGAPVFDDAGVIIGLIVGGNAAVSYATPIHYLLEELSGITL
jgi:hypothetical protein